MPTSELPTLSQVRAFTGGYLTDAANHRSDSADEWTRAFDRLNKDIVNPAGSDWTGEAAESAAVQVGTDRRRVASAADVLSAAAALARRAAARLIAAKANVLATVDAAEAGGFDIGEDFSLTIDATTASSQELAALETKNRKFGAAIRADVLALVRADEDAAAQIASTAISLRSLTFDDENTTSDRTAIQAVDFRGVPIPEKPYLPPSPPPEGWSEDPLMRAAQKIAYGHAWDKHGSEFSGMTQAELAELILDKMQRSLTAPSGLTLGLTKDGAPVIYDPKDNVLVIRDTRAGATQAGTAYKPQSTNPDYVADKAPTKVRVFTPEELADGPQPPTLFGSEPRQSDLEAPSQVIERDVGEASSRGTLPRWGTHVSPGEAAKTDGALGILGRIILGQAPVDPHNPANWS